MQTDWLYSDLHLASIWWPRLWSFARHDEFCDAVGKYNARERGWVKIGVRLRVGGRCSVYNKPLCRMQCKYYIVYIKNITLVIKKFPFWNQLSSMKRHSCFSRKLVNLKCVSLRNIMTHNLYGLQKCTYKQNVCVHLCMSNSQYQL